MTTIYTVEILPQLEFSKNCNWYKKRVGEKFEAQLSVKTYSKWQDGTRATFKVDALRSIDPNHCKIISEIKVK